MVSCAQLCLLVRYKNSFMPSPLYCTLGWSDLLLFWFSKMNTLLSIRYILVFWFFIVFSFYVTTSTKSQFFIGELSLVMTEFTLVVHKIVDILEAQVAENSIRVAGKVLGHRWWCWWVLVWRLWRPPAGRRQNSVGRARYAVRSVDLRHSTRRCSCWVIARGQPYFSFFAGPSWELLLVWHMLLFLLICFLCHPSATPLNLVF